MACFRLSRLPPLLRHAARLGLVGLLCLLGGEARAQLAVDGLILDFANPKVTRRDIMLANAGSEILYVEVQTEEILTGPGDQRPTRKGSPDELGLLVTPNRLILEPGQRRPVRAVLLQRPTVERLYQITLKPVVGDLLPEPVKAPAQKSMTIKVLVGYQALVLARPLRIEEHLQAARQGHVLRFENAGNVSVLLDAGRQCATADAAAESCDRLPSKRIWPGTAWELPLAREGPVIYNVETPEGSEERHY